MTYAGDIPPDEAWRRLRDDPDAVLVDVRTTAEWSYVGGPDLGAAGKEPVRLSWQLFPTMEVNTTFVADLRARNLRPDQPLLFLCRSGARSRAAAAAMTAAGFTACYNIAEGFEGDRDAEGHRGAVNGWKKRNLPWVQG